MVDGAGHQLRGKGLLRPLAFIPGGEAVLVRNRSRLAWRSSSQLLLLPCGCCWLLVLLPPLAVGSRQQLPSMHGASGGMAAPPPSAVQHEVCDPICSACFRAATRPGRGWLHHWSAGGVAWPLSAQLTIPRSIGDAPVNAPVF
jgi:hypothetical protein